MNQTEHFALPQWEKSDRILMEDFNAMTAAIDGLIGRFEIYTYVGNRKYGERTPCSITFSRRPVFAVVFGRKYSMLIPGFMDQHTTQRTGSDASSENEIFWEGNTLNWYNASYQNYQYNAEGETYYLMAFFAPQSDIIEADIAPQQTS
jgi:hypothetical protein